MNTIHIPATVGTTTLVCPLCGCPWTHIDEVLAITRPREDAPATTFLVGGGKAKVTDEQGFDPGRRQSFTLLGTCEWGGCNFAITFKQNRGETEVSVTNRGED